MEWAVLASIVALISSVLAIVIKSTRFWARLEDTVNNLSKVVNELSGLIKEIQSMQNDILQRVSKEETATRILESRINKIETEFGYRR